MYITHRDFPNNCWNVFRKCKGIEIFIKSYPTQAEAQAHCDVENGLKARWPELIRRLVAPQK